MSYKNVVLATTGLRHYWRMNDPVTIPDLGPGAVAMTTVSTPGSAASLVKDTSDSARMFDGTTDRCFASTTQLSGITAMSMECWAIQGANPDWAILMGIDEWPNARLLFQKQAANNNIIFGLRTNAGIDYSCTGAYPASALFHAVGTYNGSTLRFYVNGVEVASGAGTGSWAGARTHHVGGNATPNWVGTIDEVALYNVALPAPTVFAHYKAGISAGGVVPGLMLPV